MIKYILMALFISGCTINECEVADVRCDGNILQVCGSENEWLSTMDCGSIEPANLNWTCCLKQEACVPKGECE
jgi:hypothetical protein